MSKNQRTLQQRLIIGLETRGFRQSATRYKGCVAMERADEDHKYFVGRLGSLRRGATRSTSVPYDKTKNLILQEVSP